MARSGLLRAASHGDNQCRDAGNLPLPGFADHARLMVLRDMRDFMRKNRGQFRLGFRRQNQARVHTDHPARNSERVQ